MLQGKAMQYKKFNRICIFQKKTVANANATNIESHSITFDLDKVKLSTEQQSCLMRRKHSVLKASKFDQLWINKYK